VLAGSVVGFDNFVYGVVVVSYIVIYGEELCATASLVPSWLNAQPRPVLVGSVVGFDNFVYGVVVVSYIVIYGDELCATASLVPSWLNAQP